MCRVRAERDYGALVKVVREEWIEASVETAPLELGHTVVLCDSGQHAKAA